METKFLYIWQLKGTPSLKIGNGRNPLRQMQSYCKKHDVTFEEGSLHAWPVENSASVLDSVLATMQISQDREPKTGVFYQLINNSIEKTVLHISSILKNSSSIPGRVRLPIDNSGITVLHFSDILDSSSPRLSKDVLPIDIPDYVYNEEDFFLMEKIYLIPFSGEELMEQNIY